MFVRRMVASGVALWLTGTVLVRVAGHAVLPRPAAPEWIAWYAISLAAMAVVARIICGWARIPPADRLAAVAMLILPTLILDACTSLYFSRTFPNLPPETAGAFAGWMLICCGGAVLGVWRHR
jgi:fucose permease